MAKAKKAISRKPSVLSVSSFVILTLYSVAIIAILIWTIIFGFTDYMTEIYFVRGRSYLVLPKTLHTENIGKVYDFMVITIEAGLGTRVVQLPEMFLNSMLYGLGTGFTGALAPCLVAYATSRHRFKLNAVLDTVVLVTMILPVVGALPSSVRIVYGLGVDNSMPGLWVLSFSFANLYYFIFKATFKNIPIGISEAAKIDGAGHTQIFLRIMLPLVKTIFFTIMLLIFVSVWNNYNNILIYAPNVPTAAYGLYVFMHNTRVSEPTLKMTGAILLMVPVLVLFICFNKQLMGNLTMGSVKG